MNPFARGLICAESGIAVKIQKQIRAPALGWSRELKLTDVPRFGALSVWISSATYLKAPLSRRGSMSSHGAGPPIRFFMTASLINDNTHAPTSCATLTTNWPVAGRAKEQTGSGLP